MFGPDPAFVLRIEPLRLAGSRFNRGYGVVTTQAEVEAELVAFGGSIRWSGGDTLKMLLLRGDGRSRREIAQALGKSEWSVKKRLARVRRRVA